MREPTTNLTTVQDYLSNATSRVPLSDAVNPGYSGATLERLTLADGTRVILKQASPTFDLGMRATDDPGRAFLFLTDGIYDRLPSSIDAAVLAVERRDDLWMMIMRDVSGFLLPEDRRISREESRRILGALAQLHAEFEGESSPLLSNLETHLTLFSRDKMAAYRNERNPLPGHAIAGWDRFESAVSSRLRDAVFAIHASPSRLAAKLRTPRSTLTHADLALANVGLAADSVIVLDFALACRAPGEFDFAIYLVNNDWLIDASADELIEDWRETAGPRFDDGRLQLALLGAFVEYGCWKAPENDNDSPYAATFDWWVRVAERTLSKRVT